MVQIYDCGSLTDESLFQRITGGDYTNSVDGLVNDGKPGQKPWWSSS